MSKSKGLRGQALKEHRRKISILRQKGLTGIDARSAKGTRYQKELIKRYADVIAGKAKVLKADKKFARENKDVLRSRGDRIVINPKRGETLRYDRKRKQVIGTREEYGRKIERQVFYPKGAGDMPKLPRGKRYYYSFPFNGWSRSPRFDRIEDLEEYLRNLASQYNRDFNRSFGGWAEQVDVEIVSDLDDLNDGDDFDMAA